MERPDTKQQKVNDFIESFNKFSDEFPDLRDDEQTKEELMRRVDILNNTLWDVIETRKEEALTEHQRVQKGGWVEHEMKVLISHVAVVMQQELTKFFTILQILTSCEDQPEINVNEMFSLLSDQGYEPMAFDNRYPIIDKLLSNIFKKFAYICSQHPQTASN